MAFKLLLVEDDNNLREIYEARLQAEGYTILTAKDGEEALVVAKSEKPDLIISDVMMPRISGFEMLDIMRNTDELKYTKVIMLTALGQSEDKTRANSLGADRYLVKSQVTLEDIVKAAHELTDSPPAATPPPAAIPQPPAAVTPTGMAAPPPAPPPDMPVQTPPPVSPVVPAAPTTMPVAVTPPPQISVPQTALPPEPAILPAATLQPISAPVQAATADALPPVQVPDVPVSAAVPAEPSQPASMSDFSTPAAQAIAQPANPAPTSQPMQPRRPQTDQLNPSTTAEEKATVDAQIADFANQPPPVVEAPALETAAQAGISESAARSDDAILAGAMNNLAASSNLTSPNASPAAPATNFQPQPSETASETADNAAPADSSKPPLSSNMVTIANKKMIHPPEHEPKPGLDELLAREQKKDVETAGFGQVMTAPAPIVANASDSASIPELPQSPQPGAAFSPSASPMPAQPTATPAAPVAAPANGGFDPNSIAL